ncbi:leucine-rich repeat protein [Perkinsela sp. CCAP 1560/4]|nr:leucine-rich repeat protein [Perkinsela sp. CCAP 1560/4]|eukprot:KNH03893.1 leucine-rich repeat protein [Perkinsela sp. CCAP 1560/4]
MDSSERLFAPKHRLILKKKMSNMINSMARSHDRPKALGSFALPCSGYVEFEELLENHLRADPREGHLFVVSLLSNFVHLCHGAESMSDYLRFVQSEGLPVLIVWYLVECNENALKRICD